MRSVPPISFAGRVAVITGAGRGLGRAYALELARRGASVVVNDAGFNLAGSDAGDPAPADAVVQEIRDRGGQALASHHDITAPKSVQELVQMALDGFGRVDILVNNAGNNRRATFAEMRLEDFHAVLAVHLTGPLMLSQAVYPHMVRQRHGRIVFTTSQVGFYGKVDSVAYGMAKNAVIGLMHGMKLDAQQHGIRVNCISPFAITRMGDVFPRDIAAQIDPAQVAAALAWLCCDECPLHGEIMIAGGGHFARAVTLESRGIDIEDPAAVSAEQLRRRWRSIASLRAPLQYSDALQAVGRTFDAIKRRSGKSVPTPRSVAAGEPGDTNRH